MKEQIPEVGMIRKLEERLLKPSVRHSVQDVSGLLADEFIEYGSSGRIFTKKQVVEGLQSEGPVELSLSDFKAKPLASGVILATFRGVKREPGGQKSYSLRSSIWQLIDGKWQIVFHQGTPTKDEK